MKGPGSIKANAALMLSGGETEEGGGEGEDEGESQVREQVKQAMAASKTGEGNAWMKMMNLCVFFSFSFLSLRLHSSPSEKTDV